MRVLLDNNVPGYVRGIFVGHDVKTAYRQGWASLSNGNLLDVAEQAGFELFITLDRNLPYQQNLTRWSLCIVVLNPRGQSEADLRATVAELIVQWHRVQPGTLIEIDRPMA